MTELKACLEEEFKRLGGRLRIFLDHQDSTIIQA